MVLLFRENDYLLEEMLRTTGKWGPGESGRRRSCEDKIVERVVWEAEHPRARSTDGDANGCVIDSEGP